MEKTHDLVVKTGEYTDKHGDKKNRYVNVGQIMKGDNGDFILLNRTFNPAGVPNPDNRDTVLISKFEVKKEQPNGNQKPAGTNPDYDNPFSDDSVPF